MSVQHLGIHPSTSAQHLQHIPWHLYYPIVLHRLKHAVSHHQFLSACTTYTIFLPLTFNILHVASKFWVCFKMSALQKKTIPAHSMFQSWYSSKISFLLNLYYPDLILHLLWGRHSSPQHCFMCPFHIRITKGICRLLYVWPTQDVSQICNAQPTDINEGFSYDTFQK